MWDLKLWIDFILFYLFAKTTLFISVICYRYIQHAYFEYYVHYHAIKIFNVLVD